MFLHRVKVHLLDQLLFLRPNVSNFIIKETAPILGFLLASTIHFIDDHTEDIECDDIEEQCREVKKILMMMIVNKNVNIVDNFDDGLIKISP